MTDTPRTDAQFANPPTNDEAYDFASQLERELQKANADAAAKERKPMENPEMEWINDLSSMSNETKTLLAQLSKQTITIQQYRLECAEKDMLRNSAEAQNQMLRDAISLCINTVECASTDSNGNELPWYKAAKAALSTNAGRELLAELKRLRAQHEFSDGQAAYYARLCDAKDAELNSLRDDLKSAREEVERAKADRNKSGVEERRKYLPKIQELTADLAKAQSHLAELKSEVETWNECYRFISDFYAQNPPDRWLNSRARKAVTGKLT